MVGENNRISGGFSELLNPMETSRPNVYNWNHVPNSHRNDNNKRLTMDNKKLTRDSTQVTNTNRYSVVLDSDDSDYSDYSDDSDSNLNISNELSYGKDKRRKSQKIQKTKKSLTGCYIKT